MIKHFLDEDRAVAYRTLQNRIIQPAYQLADMIKGSTSGYRFEFVANSSSRDAYLEARDATLYKLVDARTGAEEETEASTEGCIGRLRMCVFPSLERVQDDGERVCMSKAIVVLEKLPKLDEDATTTVSETTLRGDASDEGSESGKSVRASSINNGESTSQDHNASDCAKASSQHMDGASEYVWGSPSDQNGGGTRSTIVW